MRKFVFAAMLVLAGAGAALAQSAASVSPHKPGPLASMKLRAVGMELSSPDFADGGIIPDKFTGKVNVRGEVPKAISPALKWTGVPEGTKSFAVIMYDLDVMFDKSTMDNLHWLAFNIPGTATGMPQAVPNVVKLPDGTIQPVFRLWPGYEGPGAPAPIYHHYVFGVWALDTMLNLPETATREDVMKAMDGHVLDKGFMVGRFHR